MSAIHPRLVIGTDGTEERAAVDMSEIRDRAGELRKVLKRALNSVTTLQ